MSKESSNNDNLINNPTLLVSYSEDFQTNEAIFISCVIGLFMEVTF